MIDPVGKFVCINRLPDAMIIWLLVQNLKFEMFTGKESQAGFGNFIIHHRIELIALKPALGLMPDFTDNIGIWINGTYPIAKFMPEGIIVNFGGHIQAPAVNAKIDPILGDLEQKFTYRRNVCVELG